MTYPSAEAMLFDVENWSDADGLILDIEMGAMNGMALAKAIRLNDAHIPILFITGYEHFVFEGYDVGAVTYLLKPASESKLFTALDRVRTMSEKSKAVLLLEGKDAFEKVYLSDVIYLESHKHDTEVVTLKTQITINKGISQFESELSDRGFCMPHRSYLVNIERISKITKTAVLMDGGHEIPIARGKWAQVNQCYLDYYRRGRNL
jgi:DNA-binding LytR/AlgR family response regulator